MFKAILGYDIEPGVTAEEYERWLFEVHAPDLLANPYLDRIVFNKVLGPVTQTSGGAADVRENLAGIHVRPVRLRVEGFGEGAEAFTWPAEALE